MSQSVARAPPGRAATASIAGTAIAMGRRMQSQKLQALGLAFGCLLSACVTQSTADGVTAQRLGPDVVPAAQGLYVLNAHKQVCSPSTGGTNCQQTCSLASPDGCFSSGTLESAAYCDGSIKGNAIFVPLWNLFNPQLTSFKSDWDTAMTSTGGLSNPNNAHWSWDFVDTNIFLALRNPTTCAQKNFSLAVIQGLPTGFPQGQFDTGPGALPQFFFNGNCPNDANAGFAPCDLQFQVYAAGSQSCITPGVLLPWNAHVQLFWGAVASALATHLKNTCFDPSATQLQSCSLGGTPVYNFLTLVHLPGMSIYDEEVRLPFGYPAQPCSTSNTNCCDTLARCVINNPQTGAGSCLPNQPNAYQTLYSELGYAEDATKNTTNAMDGFINIATSFAQSFPDRMLGMTLFNSHDDAATFAIDLPNFTLSKQFANSPSGRLSFEALRIVERLTSGATPIVPANQLLIQADDLGSRGISYSQAPPMFGTNDCYPRFVQPGALDLQARFPATTLGWQSNLQGTGSDAGGALCWTAHDGSWPGNANACGSLQPAPVSCESTTSTPYGPFLELGLPSWSAWPTPAPASFPAGWPVATYLEVSPVNVALDSIVIHDLSFLY